MKNDAEVKSFRAFMEDGMGSGAAGLQSSGGAPSIPSTSTAGVKGTGDDNTTVPVSKKQQSAITKFKKSEYKRTVPTVALQTRASRVKEVHEETHHSVHVSSYHAKGHKQLNSDEFSNHVKAHGGQLDYVSDKGAAFKFPSAHHAAQFHRGVQTRFRELSSENDSMYEATRIDASKTPRRITSTMRVGERTAPAQTFMTKEETVKSQKQIVAANSKTSENPTGALPKKAKFFSDVRSPIKD